MDRTAGDIFGRSVAVSGSWEIVGAPGRDNKIGKAYFFERGCDRTWTEAQELPAPVQEPGANFGLSVAISGDWAIVGAPGEGGRGAAYIFERGSDSNWSQVFKGEGTSVGGLYGFSVGIGDGWAIVGAPRETEGFSRAGAAYILEYNGVWQETRRLTAVVPQVGASFGFGVSMAPGGDWALVGAYVERDGGGDVIGAAYFFGNADGDWDEVQRAPGTVKGQLFGLSVSLSDDWAIIGEWGGNNTTTAGAAHIFERGGRCALLPWMRREKLLSLEVGDNFGYSVSMSPGGERAVVGATGDDTGLINDNVGAAYLFKRDGYAWNEPPEKLEASDREPGDLLGISVAVSDVWVVAGAYLEDSGGLNAGAAYLFLSGLSCSSP